MNRWSTTAAISGALLGGIIGLLIMFVGMFTQPKGFSEQFVGRAVGGPIRGHDVIARQDATNNLFRVAEFKLHLDQPKEALNTLLAIDDSALLAENVATFIESLRPEQVKVLLEQKDLEETLVALERRINDIHLKDSDMIVDMDPELPPIRHDLRAKGSALLSLAKVYLVLQKPEIAANLVKKAQAASEAFQTSVSEREKKGSQLEMRDRQATDTISISELWTFLWPVGLTVFGFIISGLAAPLLEAIGKNIIGLSLAQALGNERLRKAFKDEE